MSIPCRCRKCGARKSITRARFIALGKQITEWRYKCACGNRSWRIDRWRIKNELGIKPTCFCGGYWFPHRAKSKWCEHNPKFHELESEARRV